MSAIFHTIVVDPLYNLLIAVHNLVPPHDFGVTIIIVTLIIKVAMLHLSKKQIEGQRKMQELQPFIKEIQKKYKTDKEKQSRELLALYKKHNTTPVSGCLPLIIQLIIFIAFYRILFTMKGDPVIVDGSMLYAFVPNPETIAPTLLGLINLSIPSPILAVLAAVAQYVQMKMMLSHAETAKAARKAANGGQEPPKEEGAMPEMQDFLESMSKQMLYIGPIMTLVIGFTFPGGLALYWFISTAFTAIQQYYIFAKNRKSQAS